MSVFFKISDYVDTVCKASIACVSLVGIGLVVSWFVVLFLVGVGISFFAERD